MTEAKNVKNLVKHGHPVFEIYNSVYIDTERHTETLFTKLNTHTGGYVRNIKITIVKKVFYLQISHAYQATCLCFLHKL